VEKGKTILRVEGLSALNDKGIRALDRAAFSIREGEIFGVAGVSGNGQSELVEVLAGLRDAEEGSVLLDDQDISNYSSFERWQRGIGYIPADRQGVGSIGNFSLVENTAMNYYFDRAFSQRGAIDYGRLRRLTEEFIDEYNVAAPGPDVKARNLSGGNLQKMILARVLSRNPRLIIADLPTQGLDIGATEFVRNKLVEAKKQKAGVLLISEDLDEILAISDWVAPIYEGRIMGLIPIEEARREHIGAMMAGIEQAEDVA
jgi:simple sugar transport system ATP-binding protein